ncbi:NAD-dependent epimerase/dehydratase family protein [Rhodococcus erythropolis]|uniref:NAD-dependent epimerase/dehydratase family protein n=1 Tax=Rhodococcus erythropolis TaxID=1833 RepID=UPI001BE80552|nr:NAD-dependent epimerase/dehydratase family protein [Rhodococcus erythropolis]MBT2269020.1 NAD-dependent epimerase/dehydratase family protein [Rhodococcus erythropolis]
MRRALDAVRKVVVLGGDGYIGWPLALDQSAKGHEVLIIDNCCRRRTDEELSANPLRQLGSPTDRTNRWQSLTGKTIEWADIDVADDPVGLRAALLEFRPDVVFHLAEQRSAPYSMLTENHRLETISRNTRGTHNVLLAVRALAKCHLIHVGSLGVYGYSTKPWEMPDGYLTVHIDTGGTAGTVSAEIMHPFEPVSIYHLSKCLDAQLFEYYARTERMQITDIHQGVVWGSETPETRRHPGLATRIDVDDVYGTVVNRLLHQAARGEPLTVYGTGEQTRGFVGLVDVIHGLELSVRNPPPVGHRTRIRNQVAETLSINELAHSVAAVSGARITHIDNPRSEPVQNTLAVSHHASDALGFEPSRLTERISEEFTAMAEAVRDKHQEGVSNDRYAR